VWRKNTYSNRKRDGRLPINFEYPKDQQYFIDLLAKGDLDLFNNKYINLFDFRDTGIKRKEFNSIRNKVFNNLIIKYGKECQLKLLDNCEIDNNLVVDHYIPLSTNELNKKLRKLKPEIGKKVKTQSFGSNHIDNFKLACSKCNAFKKHKIMVK